MLVITRRVGESILLKDGENNIRVKIIEIKEKEVVVGMESLEGAEIKFSVLSCNHLSTGQHDTHS